MAQPDLQGSATQLASAKKGPGGQMGSPDSAGQMTQPALLPVVNQAQGLQQFTVWRRYVEGYLVLRKRLANPAHSQGGFWCLAGNGLDVVNIGTCGAAPKLQQWCG